MGAPLGELVALAGGIVVAGILTGILAGLFGIGGGAIIVPVLYELFLLFGVPETVRMQLCVGTSLAIIVPTTIRSYRAHKARGFVISEVMQSWTIPSMAGVALGSIIAAFAPGGVFEAAFIVFAVSMASKLLFAGESWNIGDELPGRGLMRLYGFLIGLGSSLMGIAGGSLVALVLTLYRKPIHNAVATAAGVGVPITLAGTLGYALAGLPRQSLMPPFSVGFVSAIGVLLIAPISSWVAPFGARLAHAMPRRRLEISFGFFLLAAAARFIASFFGY
ncbi:MAG TPA: sulfite exporter TauE/SafE family protein [Stellaceae bacterium]|nr:sulfite exporter TauE/SafE family protein [Stellaceae bacterium]